MAAAASLPAEHLPVLNAFQDGDDHIVLIERLPDGMRRKRRVRAEYTSYLKRAQVGRDLERIIRSSDSVVSVEYEGEEWMRLGWRDQYLRRRGIRYFETEHQRLKSYEGDVSPIRFYLTKNKAPIGRPRFCYLDLETDSRLPFSRKDDMRILCWAVVDAETGEKYTSVLEEDSDADEERLLTELWALLNGYDQVLAWNGDGFDFPVMEARTKRHAIRVDMRRWLWLDQLVAWRKMNQHSAESGAEKESFRLEDIAQAQIGEGKEKAPQFVIDRFGDVPLGSIAWELWEAGGEFRQVLVDYNIKDTDILRKLEKKKGYLTLFQAVCEATGVFGNTQGLNPTQQMDGFLMRLGRDLNYRFSTKRYADESEIKKFKGAWVLIPRTVGDDEDGSDFTPEDARKWREKRGMDTGILRDVHVCDFASLYPSVILTFNLSEDVIVKARGTLEEARAAGHCHSPGTNLITSIAKHGILTIALRELLRLRKYWADLAATLPPGTPEWQDAMAKSTAYKVVANSFYGVAGSPTSRFFERLVAESTTQNSVWLLKLVLAEAEARAMEGIYGDTDSAFIMGPSLKGFGAFVDWLNKKHFPKKVAERGCAENHIKLAFEKSFSRIIFTAKKRYCGTFLHYKWSTTCNHCKNAKGQPGSVDVRTLTCRDCGHVYEDIPKFLGKPEVKGLEYKRGDVTMLARKLQGQVIDLLVGGMKWKDDHGVEHPYNPDIETPTEDLAIYDAVLSKMRDHVLTGELSRAEVKLSRALKGSIRSYEKKKCPACKKQCPANMKVCPKCDHAFVKGEEETVNDAAHVAVARIMQERGQEVGERTRIEFVVVDGSVSPHRVIPADDYVGDCDRFYLWEKLVFPPTLRLLQAAFPNRDWESWHKVRPKKQSKKSRAKEGQLGLLFDASPRGDADDLALPAFSAKALTISIPQSAGPGAVERVRAVLQANPGARPVQLAILTDGGHERPVVDTAFEALRVRTGPGLRDQVARAIEGP